MVTADDVDRGSLLVPPSNTYAGIDWWEKPSSPADLDAELEAYVEATGRDPIVAMVHDETVSAAEMCEKAIDDLFPDNDALLDPAGAVEVFDVDLGRVVRMNNNRRMADGFADRVQRDLKGAIR